MRNVTNALLCATVTLVMANVLPAASPARAEGDWPYSGANNQDFDNKYRTYKRNDGVSTNFISELLPLNPFGGDGRLKFESRDVTQPGTGATRFDHSNTGLQIDFNF